MSNILVNMQHMYVVHPMKYAQGPCFVVFCWGLSLVNFTHILQGYFTGTGAMKDFGFIATVPVK